ASIRRFPSKRRRPSLPGCAPCRWDRVCWLRFCRYGRFFRLTRCWCFGIRKSVARPDHRKGRGEVVHALCLGSGRATLVVPFVCGCLAVQTALDCRDITKTYGQGPLAETVLDGVSLTLPTGAVCAVVGPSGSGKTTLLSILGCLLSPTSGKVTLQGEAIDFGS